MARHRSVRHEDLKKLLTLILFGIAFGYVEAAVVYYLRDLMHFHTSYTITNYHTIINLGFITFVSSIHSLLINNRISTIEVARETATIVMLLSVSYLAGKNRRQRLGAFFVGFATWDIMYYAFLKLLDNWPQSLFTKDIYFLIPVIWAGPVMTPLVISTGLLLFGAWLYTYDKQEHIADK
jgi:hypothetical protein